MAIPINQQRRIPQYRLYIDESGDHTDKEIDKPEKRYLSLTGCIIANEYYRTTFQPELERLKQKHFPHTPDQPLILHRSEIINKKSGFWRLRDAEVERNFNEILFDHKLIVKYEERFGGKIREAIQQKYNQRFSNSQVEGYGKVFLA